MVKERVELLRPAAGAFVHRLARGRIGLLRLAVASHPVVVDEIPGITIDVPAANKVIIRGIDKQVVGQFAAEVRGKRPPEPYKGKGVRYSTEVIHLKAGKTGGKK